MSEERHTRGTISCAAVRRVASAWNMLARIVVWLVFIGIPQSLPAETLREVIAKSQAPPKATSLENLDKTLLSHAVLDNAQWFVVAYFLPDSASPSERPLFVDRYDRTKQRWVTARLPAEQWRAGEADCLGLGMGLEVSPGGFLLGTHLNPSAECLLLMSPDLQVRAALYGWYLASFRDGSIVYHRSQVHFASAHPLEIGLWNRKTRCDYALFPRKPFQPVRLAEIEKLREFFRNHEEWCNIHNHPCDPEWFDGALDGNIALNEASDAVAFVVNYGSDRDDPNAPPVTIGHRKAIYVYRHVRDESSIEYREILQEDFTAQFGNVSLPELLTPARLSQIFDK